MEFPTYKELGEKVAKEALDTFEYNGKTLREWIEIIASNDGDTISRKAAIDAIDNFNVFESREDQIALERKIAELPPADEPSKVARDIARIVENEQDMRVIAQSEKRTETHGVCLDAISRQAAIMKILGQPPEPHYPSWYAEQIKELPPAEPKRGKWIDDGDPLMLTCGNCGYVVMRYNNTPFCPNCGADMRGEICE